MGSIYLGIATPEESAAIGATTAIIIALLYRRLSLKGMHGALLRTVSVTAMIMFMVLGGNIFAFTLSWNEFIYALTFISVSAKKTVSIGVRRNWCAGTSSSGGR
jgi:TRAP-type mannitol/chloroaromatic compound transport system permease large subunit